MNFRPLVSWCSENYGVKGNTPSVTYDLNLEKDGQKGYFDFDRNLICVNANLSTAQLIQTVLHEYQHYRKHSVEDFEKYYNLGHDYDNHPMEAEAEEIAQRDWQMCLAETLWRKH